PRRTGGSPRTGTSPGAGAAAPSWSPRPSRHGRRLYGSPPPPPRPAACSPPSPARTCSTCCARPRPGSICPPASPTSPRSRAPRGCAPNAPSSPPSPRPTSATAIRAAPRRYGSPSPTGWPATAGSGPSPTRSWSSRAPPRPLALLGRVLGDNGIREIAVEDPGSLGVRQHLRHARLDTPPVPVDADGIRVDVLRAQGAPAVLVTPAHQFPTGVVLGGHRRRELTRWADAGGLIVEDDYDAEHRYDRPPVPALRSMLPERVAYVGSVSKLLAPALRIGWMIPPPPYRDAIVEAKRYADLGNAALPQLVLAHLMESGAMERQLRLLRTRHRRRRDAMIDAIGARLPGAVVHGAAAGLHLMVTFDAGFADTDLAAAALARGVKTQPLSWHSRARPQRPGLVLGYAARTATEIAEGVALLGDALRTVR
ncbi:LOW QUALITY PROTEIN: GntR family transcriptional regulator, partial [Streptomyces himastatinicus ATCC 53653]